MNVWMNEWMNGWMNRSIVQEVHYSVLTLNVLVTTIDALGHF